MFVAWKIRFLAYSWIDHPLKLVPCLQSNKKPLSLGKEMGTPKPWRVQNPRFREANTSQTIEIRNFLGEKVVRTASELQRDLKGKLKGVVQAGKDGVQAHRLQTRFHACFHMVSIFETNPPLKSTEYSFAELCRASEVHMLPGCLVEKSGSVKDRGSALCS